MIEGGILGGNNISHKMGQWNRHHTLTPVTEGYDGDPRPYRTTLDHFKEF